ncbi:MAG: hypothetical protein KBA26_02240, partial [Candidatus Delongbacteria bacterium]|nr:hypothetical protein [Candidatus Delongbacteria bacterium]
MMRFCILVLMIMSCLAANPWRSDARELFITDSLDRLYHLTGDGETIRLTESRYAATYYTMSSGEDWVGYKDFTPALETRNELQQNLYLYRPIDRAVIIVEENTAQVGLPAFGQQYIAYFKDKTLRILDRQSCQPILDCPLGEFANLIAFQPGREDCLAWTDYQGQVVIYNWKTGERKLLTISSGREGYQPIWSPDGSHLLVPTVEGSLALINPAKPSSSTLMP